MSMSRREANLAILEHLREAAEAEPDQRFGQMLWNLEVLTRGEEEGLDDPFYDESVAILRRMEKRKQETEK